MGVYADYETKNGEWKTAEALEAKKFHTYPAYFSLLFGYGALATGMYYYRISPKHYSDFPLENILTGLFFTLLTVAEVRYQLQIKDEKPFQVPGK